MNKVILFHSPSECEGSLEDYGGALTDAGMEPSMELSMEPVEPSWGEVT